MKRMLLVLIALLAIFVSLPVSATPSCGIGEHWVAVALTLAGDEVYQCRPNTGLVDPPDPNPYRDDACNDYTYCEAWAESLGGESVCGEAQGHPERYLLTFVTGSTCDITCVSYYGTFRLVATAPCN